MRGELRAGHKRGEPYSSGSPLAEDSGSNGAISTLAPGLLGGGRMAARVVGVACDRMACVATG